MRDAVGGLPRPAGVSLLVIAGLLAALAGFLRLGARTDAAQGCADIDLQCRLDSADPGDTIRVPAGRYTGTFAVTVNGEDDAPITLEADGHVVIWGRIFVIGSDWRIRGFEITDPDNLAPGDGVEVRAANVWIINNVIHDHCDDNGLGAWNQGEDQGFYGNILWGNGCNPTWDAEENRLRHPHNIYTQNDVETYGYKVFENNVILEPGCSDNCFAFHGYGTERANLSGYRVSDNIFGTGRVLMGGEAPVYAQEWTNNVFLGGELNFGYESVANVLFQDNTVIANRLQFPFLWADDGRRPEANTVTGNQFLATTIELASATLSESGKAAAGAPLSEADTWDFNRYAMPTDTEGIVSTAANSSRFDSLEDWQALTGFDANSEAVPLPDEPRLMLMPENRYEPGLHYLAVAGFGASEATLELDGLLSVYRLDGLWQEPVATGIDRVTLPLRSDYEVFAVRVAEKTSDSHSYEVTSGRAIKIAAGDTGF